MFQNIKADIIYYKTNTDFEMEFNLCGCCRMRLLTDKASERKTLIANLSRAVSRSRIIMVVGSLFGDDGIIKTVSNAIGKSVVLADNKACGINSSDEIGIIDGSTPLVTPEGIFGGCIIESGPQTMILLTDSKNIRKPIMNSLIHPYIEDIYKGDLTANSSSAPEEETVEEVEETLEESTQEIAEETEEVAEEIVEEQIEETVEETAESEIQAEVSEEVTEEIEEVTNEPEIKENAEEVIEEPAPQIELIMEDDVEVSGNMVFESEERTVIAQEPEEYELYAEPKKIRKKEAKYYNDAYGDFQLDDAGIVADEEGQFYSPNSSLNVALTVVIAVILALLALLCFCIFYVPSKDGTSASEFVKSIFETLFG